MSVPSHQPGSRSDPALDFWLRYVDVVLAPNDMKPLRLVVSQMTSPKLSIYNLLQHRFKANCNAN